jgi:acetyl esterase
MVRVLGWLGGIVIAAAAAIFIAFQVSPWPSVWLIRYVFHADGTKTIAALAKHVPDGVSAELNIQYLPDDPDARLDIYYPSGLDGTDRTLPTIVWIHGGAFVYGDKGDVANYLKILASKGYTAVSVGYSIAPGALYPTPVRQTSAALGYLKENGYDLHVDASRIVLAGDSAGAQIAAQVANIISDAAYAEAVGIEPTLERTRLAGALLYCGVFDVTDVSFAGGFGGFLRPVLWAYSGTRDFTADENAMKTFSVTRSVTANFPPAFISAGNGDPLLPQSAELAARLKGEGVRVETLFFPEDTAPPLPHEYQFNLDRPEGQEALKRSLAFLADVTPRD